MSPSTLKPVNKNLLVLLAYLAFNPTKSIDDITNDFSQIFLEFKADFLKASLIEAFKQYGWTSEICLLLADYLIYEYRISSIIDNKILIRITIFDMQSFLEENLEIVQSVTNDCRKLVDKFRECHEESALCVYHPDGSLREFYKGIIKSFPFHTEIFIPIFKMHSELDKFMVAHPADNINDSYINLSYFEAQPLQETDLSNILPSQNSPSDFWATGNYWQSIQGDNEVTTESSSSNTPVSSASSQELSEKTKADNINDSHINLSFFEAQPLQETDLSNILSSQNSSLDFWATGNYWQSIQGDNEVTTESSSSNTPVSSASSQELSEKTKADNTFFSKDPLMKSNQLTPLNGQANDAFSGSGRAISRY